jgi:hypothetical protein
MASTYNDLGIELMATGENAGTWGTNMVIKLTGALTGTSTVTVPDSVEKLYIVENATTGSQTVTFKTVSGTGVNFTSTGYKFLFSDGTNIVEIALASPPGGSDTQIQFNNSGSFGGSANLVWDGTNLNIGATGEARFQDTTGGQYVGLKAAGTVSSSYTLVLPTATGTVDQVIKTDGSGNLSFTTLTSGTSWQAVKTTGFTGAAGEGYFCDTTSAAFTATLPAGVLGDEISFIDYAGTFDTNNLTIAPNGAEKIQGSAASLTVSVERAGLTLVYTDGTQGWLLKDK